jgi:hypothetical protein
MSCSSVPSVGNQTQLWHQYIVSFSDPEGSATSKGSAANSSGEEVPQNIDLLLPCGHAHWPDLSLFRQQTAAPGGWGWSLCRESGDPATGLLEHHLWWQLGPERCPRGLQTAWLWSGPACHGLCSLWGRIGAHLARLLELHRKGVPHVGVSFSELGAAWLQTQGGCRGHLLRSARLSVHRMGRRREGLKDGIWVPRMVRVVAERPKGEGGSLTVAGFLADRWSASISSCGIWSFGLSFSVLSPDTLISYNINLKAGLTLHLTVGAKHWDAV